MTNPMNVLIVGGGIGGLSAAISIILAGHRVKVFEVQEKIEEVRIYIHIHSLHTEMASLTH